MEIFDWLKNPPALLQRTDTDPSVNTRQILGQRDLPQPEPVHRHLPSLAGQVFCTDSSAAARSLSAVTPQNPHENGGYWLRSAEERWSCQVAPPGVPVLGAIPKWHSQRDLLPPPQLCCPLFPVWVLPLHQPHPLSNQHATLHCFSPFTESFRLEKTVKHESCGSLGTVGLARLLSPGAPHPILPHLEVSVVFHAAPP